MVRVVVEYSKTTAALRKVRRSMPGFVQKSLMEHGRFAVKFLRSDRFTPYPGPREEDRDRAKLYRRTGALQASIRHDAIKGNGGVEISAGRGLPDNRAVLNEFGGVIVGNPFVDVPLPDNLTAKTGQRKIKTVAEVLAQGGFVHKSRGGALVVLKRKGIKGGGKFEAFFVRKRSVEVPARFGFREALMNNLVLVRHRQTSMDLGARRSISQAFAR